jgi:transcriptional regulator with XRE-family HTH domain
MADATDVAQALADVLTATRKRLGLTRQQAVERMHLHTGTRITDGALLGYEHGTRALSVRRLLELGDTYQVPAPVLLAEAVTQAGRDPACPTCGRYR